MAQCLMFLRNGMFWKSQTTDNLHPLKAQCVMFDFFPDVFWGFCVFWVNFFSPSTKPNNPTPTQVKTMVHWLDPWIMKNFWLKVIQWPDGIHHSMNGTACPCVIPVEPQLILKVHKWWNHQRQCKGWEFCVCVCFSLWVLFFETKLLRK